MPTFIFFDHDKEKIETYSKILCNVKNVKLYFLNCDINVLLEKLEKYLENPFILVSPANSFGTYFLL